MTDDDRGAVEQGVRDYFDAWFEGDPDRMAQALHPELAKRRAAGQGSELVLIRAEDVIEDTRSGPKTYDHNYDVVVLDVDGDMASAVVHSQPFTEYLHLGRFDDGWQVVNAFYRRNPGY